MDWGVVVYGAITGAVGIVGILGSIWSAKIARKSATSDLRLSIAAENERALLNEKRRIYARFQARSSAMYTAAITHRRHAQEGTPADEDEASNAITDEARVALLEARSEIQLIAPREIAELASRATAYLMTYVGDTRSGVSLIGPGRSIFEIMEATNRAMRADLGVLWPPDIVTQTGDLTHHADPPAEVSPPGPTPPEG